MTLFFVHREMSIVSCGIDPSSASTTRSLWPRHSLGGSPERAMPDRLNHYRMQRAAQSSWRFCRWQIPCQMVSLGESSRRIAPGRLAVSALACRRPKSLQSWMDGPRLTSGVSSIGRARTRLHARRWRRVREARRGAKVHSRTGPVSTWTN